MTIEAAIVDTETTSLHNPEIIELGMIYLNPLQDYWQSNEGQEDNCLNIMNQALMMHNSRHAPINEIDPEATKVHGHTRQSLLEAGLKPFEGWNPHYPIKYFIAHNAQFDAKALKYPKEVKYICTVKFAKATIPGLKSYSLENLIKHLFPSVAEQLLTKAHSALSDCRLTLLLLEKLIAENDFLSWDEIYAIAGVDPKPKEITCFPFGKHKGVPFSQVPLSYLQWAIQNLNMSPELRQAVMAAMEN